MKQLLPEIEFRDDRYATRVLHDDPGARVVAFALRRGQSVPAHSSPSHVLVTVVEGSGTFHGAEGRVRMGVGTSALYLPDEVHSIDATEEALKFLAVITPRPGG